MSSKHDSLPSPVVQPQKNRLKQVGRDGRAIQFALRVVEADAEGRTVLDEPVRCARCGIPITRLDDRK